MIYVQVYFSPELMSENTYVLNIVDQEQKGIGFLSLLVNDKKMYVYGHLENEGVREDFKDLIQPYIMGMTKSNEDMEVLSYISIGGQRLDMSKETDEKSS